MNLIERSLFEQYKLVNGSPHYRATLQNA